MKQSVRDSTVTMDKVSKDPGASSSNRNLIPTSRSVNSISSGLTA